MTRPCTVLAVVLLAAQVAGCAASPRFRDQKVVWQVDDTRDIPEPKEREYHPYAYFGDTLVFRRATRVFELADRDPAQNTNALDEVPDSAWFTNRIGARAITPEEAARGPVVDGPPRTPLTVVRGKSGGGNPGFLARDTTGRTFVVKFDTHANFEMQTATSVIVNRALWTLGYNVPEDTIFHFSRADLAIDPDAKREDELGRKVPLTEEALDAILAQAPHLPDGSYRASASLFLAGVPKGGFPAEGVRRDDPNDRVPHQDRRELRGLRVFAAWLGHTDMKDDNTLSMYVEEDGRHFLRHYLIDFGEALGAHQAEKSRMEDGWEFVFDFEMQTRALLSFGLWKRPWENQEMTPWPAVGAFGAEAFEPGLWREAYPYPPFHEVDAADLYWGAKLVMRFDRPIVEAIVHEGQISDPDAEAWLVDALMGRREKIGRAWLEAVTPLDALRITEDGLCGVDLGVYYGLAADGVVERLPPKYRPEEDRRFEMRERDIEQYRVAADGSVCLPIPDHGDYVVDRLRIRRGSEFKPIMQVHYEGGRDPRILGIIRVEP